MIAAWISFLAYETIYTRPISLIQRPLLFFRSVTENFLCPLQLAMLTRRIIACSSFYIKENETDSSVKGSFSHLTKGAYPRSSVTCAKLTWDKISCPPLTPFCWRLRFVCPWRTPPWWQLDHGLLARWRSKVDGYVSSELGDNMWYWTAWRLRYYPK